MLATRHVKTPLIVSFILCFALFGLGFADDANLHNAPERIAFPGWTPLESGDGFEAFDQRFPSAIVTGNALNDLVRIAAYLPTDRTRPVPVVIILHYWGASDLRAERAQAIRLTANGIAGVIMELPYHLSRTPIGARSGERAIVPDPNSLKRTMEQAVMDVRRTVDWIGTQQDLDSTKIGLAGTSLGGIVGSAAFAVEPRITSCCSILGGADLAEIIWSSSRIVRERDRMRKAGWTKESVRAALKSVEPLELLDKNDQRPFYAIGAKFDTVVPRRSQEELMKALGNPTTLWLQTGHYGGFFIQESIAKSVTQFFVKTLNGQPFSAPLRLYAPTLRITGTANTGTGLQVGLGLDVWRSNEESTLFGTFILTPKGAEGFVGTRLSTGLALGIAIQPRRTTVGALWSFVL